MGENLKSNLLVKRLKRLKNYTFRDAFARNLLIPPINAGEQSVPFDKVKGRAFGAHVNISHDEFEEFDALISTSITNQWFPNLNTRHFCIFFHRRRVYDLIITIIDTALLY